MAKPCTLNADPSPVTSATQSTTTQETPLAVDDRGAARLLGISSRTVYSLRERGELRYRRCGRRILIPVESIRAYLAASV